MSLSSRVHRHVLDAGLLPQPGLALLAVSGGPDSVAMLDVFAALAPALGLSLLVAHADHGIASQSGAVAEQVRRLARDRYDLETVVGTLGLGGACTETGARAARYRFLRAVQRERGARYLLTAHHADDQAETVLLRLLRGSAPAGLAAMRSTGPHGLVRPFLPFRRLELVAHVEAAGLPVVQDPANADPRHLRSWVRVVLRPVLEGRLGARAVDRLLEVAAHAADEVAAWDAVLDVLPGLELAVRPGRFDIARGALSEYHNVLAGRILRAAARRAGFQLTPGVAERVGRFACGAMSGRRLPVGAGRCAEIAFDRLVVGESVTAPEPVPLVGSEGRAGFGGYRVGWRADLAPEDIPRVGWKTWVAAGNLAVRGPRAGDALRPLGGAGTRKVARLLMESRVPRAQRVAYPVVVTEGRAVWVPGICRGTEALPEPGTMAVRIEIGPG